MAYIESDLSASDKDMGIIGKCSGKKVDFTSLCHTPLLAQLGYSGRKIAYREIGLRNILQKTPYLAFATSGKILHKEMSARKIFT